MIAISKWSNHVLLIQKKSKYLEAQCINVNSRERELIEICSIILISLKCNAFFRDPENLLVVYYTDLKTSLHSQLTQILKFLDIKDINPAMIDCVMNSNNHKGKYHRPKVVNVKDVMDKDMLSYSEKIQAELMILLKYKTPLHWVEIPISSMHFSNLSQQNVFRF